MSNAPKPTPPKWLSPVTEYGPLAAFFAAYYLGDLMIATAVVMAASALAVAISWIMARSIPWMPLITAALVGVFGGLTLYLADETFIKMKPTIVQVLFTAVLLGGLAFDKQPLKYVMGKSFAMPDAAWRALTIRFSIFFLGMAALNEVVWRTQSTELWVNFKVFGLLILTFAFIASQLPFMMRHGEETTNSDS